MTRQVECIDWMRMTPPPLISTCCKCYNIPLDYGLVYSISHYIGLYLEEISFCLYIIYTNIISV